MKGLADDSRPGPAAQDCRLRWWRRLSQRRWGPAAADTQWSTRSLAQKVRAESERRGPPSGFALVCSRIAAKRSGCLEAGPWLVEKVRDIVGLYLNPPEHAIVLCVDEKSQVQALDRTQPILPLRPGLPEQRTSDYERRSTTSLFAALDIATGEVIGKCHRRHRHQEFLRFMQVVDSKLPTRGEIHLVLGKTEPTRRPQSFDGSLVIRDTSCTSPRAQLLRDAAQCVADDRRPALPDGSCAGVHAGSFESTTSAASESEKLLVAMTARDIFQSPLRSLISALRTARLCHAARSRWFVAPTEPRPQRQKSAVSDPTPVPADFSSTHNTMACSGGFRYRPAISRTFSTSHGSVDSLNVSLRCGCKPKLVPDADHGALTQPDFLRQRPRTPLRGCRRQAFSSVWVTASSTIAHP